MIDENENLKLNVEVIGKGKPVLILHGLAGHLNTMKVVFEPIFARTSDYQRIYVDLPGMGDSNAPIAFASSDKILEALLHFIKEKIGQPLLLIGYSYGGYLARAITVKMPELVDGLMLLAPMVIPTHEERMLPSNDWFKKSEKISTKKYLKAGWKEADPTFLAALDEQYAVSFEIDEQARKAQFDKVVLVVLGHQDTVVGYSDQLRLLTDYPRATFSVLDLAGHNLQMEQVELLAALVENWLKRSKNEI